MIGNVDWSAAGKKPARQTIPENLTKTKDRGSGRFSHRPAKISATASFCKQPI
jgi:hypothetical protein